MRLLAVFLLLLAAIVSLRCRLGVCMYVCMYKKEEDQVVKKRREYKQIVSHLPGSQYYYIDKGKLGERIHYLYYLPQHNTHFNTLFFKLGQKIKTFPFLPLPLPPPLFGLNFSLYFTSFFFSLPFE